MAILCILNYLTQLNCSLQVSNYSNLYKFYYFIDYQYLFNFYVQNKINELSSSNILCGLSIGKLVDYEKILDEIL